MRSDDAMMGDGADHGEGADVRGNGPAFAAGSPTEFTFTDKVIRTVLRDGEPWFVAADVCEVLEQPDTSKVVSRLEEDEKGAHSVRTPGGPQDLLVISESGLYALVLTSRKPQARPFQRWVTGEVIPSIRRTVIPRRSEGEERLADATVGDLEPELEALAGQGMTVFIFRDRRVRTVVRAGDPWFVAVGRMLGLGDRQRQPSYLPPRSR